MIVDHLDNLIHESCKVNEAIEKLNELPLKILFVVNNSNKALGTITDGDLRRGLFKCVDFQASVLNIINKDFIKLYKDSNQLFIENEIETRDIVAIPILNDDNTILRVHSARDWSETIALSNKVILMAGGYGKRLGELTNRTPKPLLKIGKKPIIQIIIENLQKYGFTNFVISIHYLSEQIIEFLGDGSNLGVNIDYIIEEKPLGTAGCLSLINIDDFQEDCLLINCDVLTNVNFRGILENHKKNKSAMTICSREYSHQVPFGVIEINKNSVIGMEEKPYLKSQVNAGIYILTMNEIVKLQKNKYLDMPDLINLMVKNDKKVNIFPIHEYWIDVGQIHDYEKAQLDFTNDT